MASLSLKRLDPRRMTRKQRLASGVTIIALVASIVSPVGQRLLNSGIDGLFGNHDQAPVQRLGAPAVVPNGGGQNTFVPPTRGSKYPPITFPQAAPANVGSMAPGTTKATAGFDTKTSKEIPDKRTATTETYLNTDGTETTAIATGPVNYQDAQGNWQPIKPTLVADQGALGGAGGFSAGGGAATSQVAGQLGGAKLAELTLDSSHAIAWSVDTASRANATISGGATATYANLANGADLEVVAQALGLKETIVLRSRDAARTFSFPLQLKGLTASLRSDGSVLLTDSSGKSRAFIPAGSMEDSASGANGPAHSAGVTYHLVGNAATPTLQVTVDGAWLDDPQRVFPVKVDPTVTTFPDDAKTNGSLGTRTLADGGGTVAPDQFQVGLKDGKRYAGSMDFGTVYSALQYQKIYGAQLGLVNYNAASCSPRPVTIYGVTSRNYNQSPPFQYDYDVVGSALASSSFAYGYVAPGASSTQCPAQSSLLDLGVGGRDLVQSWVNLPTLDLGLDVRASSDTDPSAWKAFAGYGTANPPKLYITSSPYYASYQIPNPTPRPAVTRTQNGQLSITVTNLGSQDWTPSSYYLAYRVFNSAGQLVGTERAASLTQTAYAGCAVYNYSCSTVTLNATIKALPPGSYTLDFTMAREGGPVFTDEYVPPARLLLQIFDVQPVFTDVFPPNGYEALTLTPQLWARATDDEPPAGMTYKFTLCDKDNVCVDSGFTSSTTWVPPVGKLRWGGVYTWSAIVKNATNQSSVGPITLLTDVPQPDIISHLAGSPTGDSGNYDPLVGNYSTSAIDAPIVTTGPALNVARTYNSLDPRTTGLFGAGWSSLYDTRVAVEADGTGNVLVTLASGRVVRFGMNPDGSYVAPAGERLALTAGTGTWLLRDAGSSTYTFASTGTATGRLTQLQGATGRPLALAYNATGQLTSVTSGNSGRALTFTWSGTHVASVAQPAVAGVTSTWTYTYNGNLLTQVCAPGTACTKYEYSTGSHYRSAVLDAKPDSYWRLNEKAYGSTDVASEVAVNLGTDTARLGGNFPNGTTRASLTGYPGALAGTTNTAAQLAMSRSDQFSWPAGSVKRSRDGAIEMWFMTAAGGFAFGSLMGYTDYADDGTANISQPILYIGQDGKLRGQFKTAQINPITSTGSVNDGAWHHVVLSAYNNKQTLYLDGSAVGSLDGIIDHASMTYATIGNIPITQPAAWPKLCLAGGGIPCEEQHFSGLSATIDEIAIYSHPLSNDQVTSHRQLGTTAASQLSKVTLPSGKTAAQVTYDVDADRVAQYTDQNGGTWKVGLPAVTGTSTDLRRTVNVLDPVGRTYLYEYDALTGQMLRVGAPTGLATREQDKTCTTPTPNDPSFCAVSIASAPAANPVSYSATDLAIRSFSYNDAGQLQRVYNEVGNYVDMAYDTRGNLIARTTCRTGPTDCSTTRYTFPATVSGPLDPLGDKPLEMRDGRSTDASDNRYRTQYTYSTTGAIASQTDPDGGKQATTYSLGTEAATGGGLVPSGLPLRSIDPRGAATVFAYNSLGDLVSTTEPSGLVTNFVYDTLGRKVSETQVSDSIPAGAVISYSYDALSRLTTTTAPAVADAVTATSHQQQILSTYDADGNVIKTEQRDLVGGDATRATTYSYNSLNQQERVTDANGGELSYSYDRYGNKVAMVDANGNRYRYAYTARNALAEVRLEDPNGGPGALASRSGINGYLVLQSMTYDNAGRVVSETDATGRTVTTDYYQDDLVSRKTLLNFHRPNGTVGNFVLESDTYDRAGNLLTQVTDNGLSTTSQTITASGRVASVSTNPAGVNRTTTYAYDLAGNVTSVMVSGKPSNVAGSPVTAPLNTTYAYDAAGRRISETVGLGGTATKVTKWTYDQRGLPISAVAPLGNVAGAAATTTSAQTTKYTYDALQRLTATAGPTVVSEVNGVVAPAAAITTTAGYNTYGEQTSTRDPMGRVSTVIYDMRGLAVGQKAPTYTAPGAAAVTPALSAGYDKAGQRTDTTDALGRVTRYSYDRLGNMTSLDAPAANGTSRAITSYTYTRTGQTLSVTDPTGARTEATYDDLDRQITSTVIERNPASVLTARVTYDDAGHTVATTAPSGAATSMTYDGIGQVTRATSAAGVATSYGYDGLGRNVSTIDGAGRTHALSYDAGGRLTTETDSIGAGAALRSQSYTYDVAGQLLQSTPSVGSPTTYGYDAAGRVTSQTEPITANTSIATSFGYDAAGERTRYTDGRGYATIYTFNTLALPESVIEPTTTATPAAIDRTWTASYDAAGQATKLLAPGAVTRTRVFDANGQLSTETGTAAGTTTVTKRFSYDADGRVTSVGAPGGTDTYSYNDRGLVTAAHGPSGESAITYNTDGQVARRVDSVGTADFTYANGRLATSVDPITHSTLTYSYNTDGSTKKIAYSAGPSRNIGYDDLGRVTTDALVNSAGTTVTSASYGYDLNNRVTKKATTGVAGASSNTYTYDLAGRLTSWAVAGGATTTYGYDNSGNRTKVNATTAVFDQRNQLTSDGTSTYKYTPRGTLASQTTGTVTQSFTADAFDRILTGPSQTYGYDDLDRVVTQNTNKFAYDGLTTDLVADGAQTFGRNVDGSVVSVGSSTSQQLVLLDRHGDLVGGFAANTPALAALTSSRSYDPWGKPTATTGTSSDLGFQANWTDPTSGQVDMNARWYDPKTARFDSRDAASYSAGASALANKYLYGGDDPVTLSDPTGNWPSWSDVTSAASTVYNAGAAVISTVYNAGRSVYNTVAAGATAAWEATRSAVTSAIAAAGAAARAAFQASLDAIRSAASAVVSTVSTAVNWSVSAARTVQQTAQQAAAAVSATARASIQFAVEHNPLPVLAAAVQPLYAGVQAVVSAAANLPAQVVALTVSAVQDVASSAQATYRTAVDAAGSVVQAVSVAAVAVGEFAVNNWQTIAIGIATGLACAGIAAVTAGVGALACGVVLGALVSAGQAALECPAGQSVASCAAKGAAVGAVSGLAGAGLGKLGGAIVTKTLTKIASRETSAVASGAERSVGRATMSGGDGELAVSAHARGSVQIGRDFDTVIFATRAEVKPGEISVAVHGIADGYAPGATTENVAAAIRSHPDYTPGQTVCMYSCFGGSNGTAADLAKLLGAPVRAPTTKVRLEAGSTVPILDPGGIWRVFK